jgi:hypothetical protein
MRSASHFAKSLILRLFLAKAKELMFFASPTAGGCEKLSFDGAQLEE